MVKKIEVTEPEQSLLQLNICLKLPDALELYFLDSKDTKTKSNRSTAPRIQEETLSVGYTP